MKDKLTAALEDIQTIAEEQESLRYYAEDWALKGCLDTFKKIAGICYEALTKGDDN